MHFVGIRRVSWSSAHGDRIGSKVRALIDALDSDARQNGPCGDAADDTTCGIGMFVTKHEVLWM